MLADPGLAGLRGVPGGLLYYHAHGYPDGAGPVLAGVLAVVLPGKLGIELPPGVWCHRYPATKFDVVLRVGGVDHRDADARVAQHVAVLDASFDGGKQQVTAVTADPHHGGLRAPVGVHRGQNRVITSVEQPERRLAERDSHSGTVTGVNGPRAAGLPPGRPGSGSGG